MPRSIPEVGDPKLGAAVKSGVSGWQNLYLEHIGSDRRIFSEEVDPKRSLTHHRGPSEVLSSKSSPRSCISIRGAFVVRVWCAGCKNCSQSSTACSKAGLLQRALLFLKSSCQNPKKKCPPAKYGTTTNTLGGWTTQTHSDSGLVMSPPWGPAAGVKPRVCPTLGSGSIHAAREIPG